MSMQLENITRPRFVAEFLRYASPNFVEQVFKEMNSLKLIFAAALVISCSDTTQKFDRQALDVKRQNIISFINAVPCSSSKSCSFIAAGTKACGGPAEYFVYSRDVDSTKLVQSVTAYTEEMSSYIFKWKIISDCSITPPPDSTRCLNGKCFGYWNGLARRQE
jgi:hypothetical protein